MKIYTRTGDDGTTGLFGGGRVRKYNPRIQVCGAVDETNAVIGAVLALMPAQEPLKSLIALVQNDLFDLGSDLATPLEARAVVPRIGPDHAERLEEAIDILEADLAPLRNFILPGGTPAAAMLHLARTVCRRAERQLVLAQEEEALNVYGLQYLNRLSDLLFVMARWVNLQADIEDILWKPEHVRRGKEENSRR